MLRRTLKTAGSLAVAGAIVGAITLVHSSFATAQDLWTDGIATTGLSNETPFTFGAFADLAEQVSPAVVYIEVTISGGGGLFAEGSAVGQGSGFLINQEGMIVTNDHVVDGASSIEVTLQSGRTYQANVIGTDPRTDIALIQIEDSTPFAFLPLGGVEVLRVGEWVLAVGSPFGLESTVTVGVVSALNRRDIQPDGRAMDADFIQTDASINPGNSGGPLIDMRGNVVGVNAAVRSGNNIGFAIPVDMVKRIIEQLQDGHVERSWLGVTPDELTPERAAALGLDSPHGALVGRVIPGSPAEIAGISRGDVVVEFQGESVDDFAELRWLASIAGVGVGVTMVVIRDGQRLTLQGSMTSLPGSTVTLTEVDVDGTAVLGMVVSEIDGDLAGTLGRDPGSGLYVGSVVEGSPAARAGVTAGDVLIAVAGDAITTVRDLERIEADAENDLLIRLRLQRNGAIVFVAFTVEP